jgi:NADPH:quinone reductase-like Zn-dependent oxidoreductase
VQAIVLREFGDASNLRLEEVADPRPEPGWTTVQLKASALNWHDVLVRMGRYGSPLPDVLGADGAGVDEATGDDVMIVPSLWWGNSQRAPQAGWQILGDQLPGTYAARVNVPTESVVPKPARLSWPEAAALPLVGLTVFRALFSRGRLQPGESLLVLGAGGGVPTMAVTLAAGIGAVVYVTSSSADKLDRSRELGARGGVLYTDPDWPTAAKAASPGGHGFDVVLDSVGAWRPSIDVLRRGGRLVVLGSSASDRAELNVRRFYLGQYDLLGTTMGSPADFAGLLELFHRKELRPPVIDRVFPIDRAADAHAYLESRKAFGKIVLTHE